MKKLVNIISIIIMIIVSVSCSMNDLSTSSMENLEMTSVSHEIAFFLNSNDVKANTNDIEISELNVAAYNVTSSSDYFTSTPFTKGASHFAGGKNWPNAISYINFLAYAGSESASFENAGKFTVEVSNNKDAQNDYFYAIGHGEVSQNNGVLSFPKDVELTFVNALSLVNFNVDASSDITIDNITLTGASFGGKLTVKENEFNTSNNQTVSATWSNITPSESVSVPSQGVKVIPQAMGASGFKVEYSVNGKSNYFTYFFSADEKNYESGMNYTYTLTFNENGISVAMNSQIWNN